MRYRFFIAYLKTLLFAGGTAFGYYLLYLVAMEPKGMERKDRMFYICIFFFILFFGSGKIQSRLVSAWKTKVYSPKQEEPVPQENPFVPNWLSRAVLIAAGIGGLLAVYLARV